MLGRIGSGSTVAALPWAAAIVAATEGSLCLALIFGGLTLGIMLFAFAPWILGVRTLLPARRRIKRLESFWAEGHLLTQEEVPNEKVLDWLARERDWATRAREWIADNISILEAARFRQPKRWYILDFPMDAVDMRHHRERNLVGHQLEELLRLRSEQEAKLR